MLLLNFNKFQLHFAKFYFKTRLASDIASSLTLVWNPQKGWGKRTTPVPVHASIAIRTTALGCASGCFHTVVISIVPINLLYLWQQSLGRYDTWEGRYIFIILSRTPASIQSVRCHKFAQVWCRLTVSNEWFLVAIITAILTFIDWNVVIPVSVIHSSVPVWP